MEHVGPQLEDISGSLMPTSDHGARVVGADEHDGALAALTEKHMAPDAGGSVL